MSVPCEIVAKTVLPAMRAMVTKELIKAHDLKQVEVAQLLGITQGAVSQYMRGERGVALNLESLDVKTLISNIALRLTSGRSSQQEIVSRFCEACRLIRGKGLMCNLHKTFESSFDTKDCRVCLNSSGSDR